MQLKPNIGSDPQSLWDSVSREMKAKLDVYDLLLNKWQASINLVSNSTLKDAQTRHFLDSLQLCQYIPDTAKILYDIGSGAGFPGLVIATVRPDLSVHLIESDQKKCAFLQTVSRETETPVKVHTARAERVSLPAPDVVTARALADLTELLALTERWWASWPGLTLIFPKGVAAADEVAKAKKLYRFDHQTYPSVTDKTASVLVLTHVEKCE